MFGDVAPDLATAQVRAFRRYTPSDPCPTHPHSPYFTETQQCERCRLAELEAAHAEREKQREAQDAADKAAYLALRREEAKVERARRAEERRLEHNAEVITHTVGRAGKGRKRTTERALKLIDTLPPSPKTSEEIPQ